MHLFLSHVQSQGNKVLAHLRCAYKLTSCLPNESRKALSINVLISRIKCVLPLFSGNASNPFLLQNTETQILHFISVASPLHLHRSVSSAAKWLPIPDRSTLLLTTLTFKVLYSSYCPPFEEQA